MQDTSHASLRPRRCCPLRVSNLDVPPSREVDEKRRKGRAPITTRGVHGDKEESPETPKSVLWPPPRYSVLAPARIEDPDAYPATTMPLLVLPNPHPRFPCSCSLDLQHGPEIVADPTRSDSVGHHSFRVEEIVHPSQIPVRQRTHQPVQWRPAHPAVSRSEGSDAGRYGRTNVGHGSSYAPRGSTPHLQNLSQQSAGRQMSREHWMNSCASLSDPDRVQETYGRLSQSWPLPSPPSAAAASSSSPTHRRHVLELSVHGLSLTEENSRGMTVSPSNVRFAEHPHLKDAQRRPTVSRQPQQHPSMSLRNPKGLPTLSNGRREWSSDLCSFCDHNLGTCCKAFWCPCIIYGRNKARIEHLYAEDVAHPTGGDTCSDDCAIHAFLTTFCLFGWALQVPNRASVRRRYNIDGDLLGDCAAALCCSSCELSQESREIDLEERSFQMSEWKE